MPVSTGRSIRAQILIDPLMRKRNSLRLLQPIGDLLGTPLLSEFAFDQPLITPSPLGRTARLKTALLSLSMSRLSIVTGRTFIPTKLTRNCGGMHPNQIRDGYLTMTRFFQREYFISLRQGQLAISLHVLLLVGLWITKEI
jgi:hypothetical protein